MASIVSLYSEAVSVSVPDDVLPPEPPVLGVITAAQDTNSGAIPQGRTSITLNWSAPTLNERIPGEFLLTADGNAQSVETFYDPISSGVPHELYEVTALSAGVMLSAPALRGAKSVVVTDATGIVVDSWIQLTEGAQTEYARVESVDGTTVNLYHRLRMYGTWTVAATVKVATVTLKTDGGVDYTLDLGTGVLDLVAGQFTASNEVFIEYSVILQDLDRYELYRIPGSAPLPEPATYSAVTGHISVVTVDSAISSAAILYTEVLTASENGETWTYYLFAVDDEPVPNVSYADSVEVETFPTIPQNLDKTVGDSRVTLSWDEILDINVDGINIYRTEGMAFEGSTAIKVNSIPVSGDTFEDGPGNVTNRVSSGTLPFPINGNTYSYKIESEDTATGWATGTQNESQGQSEQLLASKTA